MVLSPSQDLALCWDQGGSQCDQSAGREDTAGGGAARDCGSPGEGPDPSDGRGAEEVVYRRLLEEEGVSQGLNCEWMGVWGT